MRRGRPKAIVMALTWVITPDRQEFESFHERNVAVWSQVNLPGHTRVLYQVRINALLPVLLRNPLCPTDAPFAGSVRFLLDARKENS